MKKIAGIVLKVLAGLILLILILLFTVPVLFKEKIKTRVESVINESVNARVTFSDYKLTFFRNFPNLSFSLEDMYVAGKDNFEGDTLAGFKSFDLVFNLGSLLGKSGYEIKSIVVDQAIVNAIVLKDGKANWDIAIPSDTIPPAKAPAPVSPGSEPETISESAESSMKLLLRKLEIRNSSISYNDESMKMNAFLKDINFLLSGKMTLSSTSLLMDLKIGETTVSMDGVNYLNKAVIDSKISLLADLDSMKFTFGKNFFNVNDLQLNFSGTVAMPAENIITDVAFSTSQTSFKTLLSMVPAVYLTGYEELKATGEFGLSGTAKGVYSEADSTLPDIRLNLSVTNGLISYPDLPEKISNININTEVFVDGKDLDRTTVNMDKFHFELAGSPFDMSFFLKTPMSDPDFRAEMNGKIDLSALSKAVPMENLNLSGVIEMAVSMAGRMSMIEKEQYEDFTAKGNLTIRNMVASMTGYPRVDIKEAAFIFTPAFTKIQKGIIFVEGKSDFAITGNLENYIPYIFGNETVKGNLTLHSANIDLSSIMNAMASDTSALETVAEDTVALVIIAVPKNLDFDFNALIDKFTYDNIRAENLKGHVIIRNGVLIIRETGMDILGGKVTINADYDTRDTLKPVMKADLNISNIAIKDAYSTFVTIREFAPTAKGINGKVNMQLAYESLLGSDMMPVMESIDGYGKLQSDEVQLVESATFDKLKQVLKLGDKYSNTFKDVNISFKIKDGRIYVNPFNVKLGNVKMNISGDQGLDQTINYLIKTEIPRSDLGSSVNSLIDNLSAQAAAFGIAYKPADVIKVNVRVRGTFAKPEVSPDFGGGSDSGTGTGGAAKEVVKQTIDNTVDKTKDQLRDEAARQGDRLIQEAEVRGQQLRDEATRAAQRLRQEADSSGARLVKSAETKNVLAKAAAQKGAEALKKEAGRRGSQLIQEADIQANKLVEEAKVKKEELIRKI